MRRLSLKLFALAIVAALPAFANTVTSTSDTNGVHVNFAAASFYTYDVAQVTLSSSGITNRGYDGGFLEVGEASIGGNLASFSDAAGEHVFFIGWDGNVHELLYPSNPDLAVSIINLTNLAFGSALSAPSRSPGAESPLTTGLTACNGTAGQFVFYVDLQQHVIVLTNNGTSFSSEDLTASFGGPTVNLGSNLVSFCGGIWGQEVFYVDTNNNVNQFSFDPFLCSGVPIPRCGAGWINSNLTANTKGSTVFEPPNDLQIPLTGFQDSFGTHIFYVASTNRNINQLWLQSSGSWVNQNVMPLVACEISPFGVICPPPLPLPATAGALSSLTDSAGVQHVFYIDANQGISELSHNPNLTTGWGYGSPTVSAGVSLTGGEGSGHPVDSGCSMMQLSSVVDGAGTQRVYYVDSFGDLNQLLLGSGSSSWTNSDLYVESYGSGKEPQMASGCMIL